VLEADLRGVCRRDPRRERRVRDESTGARTARVDPQIVDDLLHAGHRARRRDDPAACGCVAHRSAQRDDAVACADPQRRRRIRIVRGQLCLDGGNDQRVAQHLGRDTRAERLGRPLRTAAAAGEQSDSGREHPPAAHAPPP
jgi:hypothetical protein